MPNQYFQLYNHAYSFETSQVFSGGVTYSLPQNDYGIYGDQVDAYFNTISESVGATGNLAVWFVADKGLTYYRDDPGASAAVTGYIEGRFPVTPSTQGLGLVDLRGAPEWKHLIGDGIIGPTLASTQSVTSYSGITGYVQSISLLMRFLSARYPNIDWAIAGLPHLPFQMPLAPTGGSAPVWDASLTNTESYGGWWDVSHPKGSTNLLYDWQGAPTELKDFYTGIAREGIQRYIFDTCFDDIGWICPDIRTPFVSEQEFYQYGYNPESNYERNFNLNLIASEWALDKFSVSYPMISPMHPTRGLNVYDASNGRFLAIDYNDQTGAYSITAASFTGSSGSARDNFYSAFQFRVDMLAPAIEGEANGFVYYDPIPTMIDAACTGNISVGATGYVAQVRSRNTFSSLFYGGSYQDGYAPSGSGYADPCVKTDLLQNGSKATIAYLNEIREAVNLEAPGSPPQTLLMRNGYINPTLNPYAPAFVRNNSAIVNQRPVLTDALPWVPGGGGGGGPDNCCPPPCETPNCTSTQTGFDLSRCSNTLNEDCKIEAICDSDPDDGMPGGVCNSCTFKSLDVDCSNACPCGCNGGTYTLSRDDIANLLNGSRLGSANSCRPQSPPIDIGGLPSNCTVIVPDADDSVWDEFIDYDPNAGVGPCCATICPCAFDITFQTDCSGGGGIPLAPFPMNGRTYPYDIKTLGVYSNDVVVIHNLRNYERSTNSVTSFNSMVNRKRSLPWKRVYQSKIDKNAYATFTQSLDTILKPEQSVPAIKTHYEKDPIRHYPGKYFT